MSITGGTNQGLFTIDQYSGELTFNSGQACNESNTHKSSIVR